VAGDQLQHADQGEGEEAEQEDVLVELQVERDVHVEDVVEERYNRAAVRGDAVCCGAIGGEAVVVRGVYCRDQLAFCKRRCLKEKKERKKGSTYLQSSRPGKRNSAPQYLHSKYCRSSIKMFLCC
jgi:hypothetical protein